MKKQTWTLTGMLVVLGGSMAMAQMPGGGAGAGRPGGRMMERFDTDGDGVLSEAERTAMQEARGNRQRRGAATPEAAATDEAAAPATAPQGPNPRALMRRFDTNGDEMLNQTELAALLASMGRPVGVPQRGQAEATAPEEAEETPAEAPAEATRPARQGRAGMMEQYDTDGDGTLSEEERTAMMEAMRARQLERFDTDGDGEISEEERAAMPQMRRGAGRMGAPGAAE